MGKEKKGEKQGKMKEEKKKIQDKEKKEGKKKDKKKNEGEKETAKRKREREIPEGKGTDGEDCIETYGRAGKKIKEKYKKQFEEEIERTIKFEEETRGEEEKRQTIEETAGKFIKEKRERGETTRGKIFMAARAVKETVQEKSKRKMDEETWRRLTRIAEGKREERRETEGEFVGVVIVKVYPRVLKDKEVRKALGLEDKEERQEERGNKILIVEEERKGNRTENITTGTRQKGDKDERETARRELREGLGIMVEKEELIRIKEITTGKGKETKWRGTIFMIMMEEEVNMNMHEENRWNERKTHIKEAKWISTNKNKKEIIDESKTKIPSEILKRIQEEVDIDEEIEQALREGRRTIKRAKRATGYWDDYDGNEWRGGVAIPR